MTTRFFIRLAYLGTQYSGWQIQTNAKTIQGVLIEKMSKLLSESIIITGAGRTDAGVHAKCFYGHFDSTRLDAREVDKTIYHLNSILPGDIAVHSIIPVKTEAHARYSAISRTYEYHLHSKKNPFLEGISYYFHRSLKYDEMQMACKLLMEYDDFKSFSKNNSDVKTYLCDIYKAEWKLKEDKAVFEICADRFLRNMVRAIVGTMLELGKGNINLDDFKRIILSRDRSKAGESVPPHGLFLTDIQYPGNIFI